LIELMIVVAIIGLLASIAIPAYQSYVARAQASEGEVLLGSLKSPVMEYWLTQGTVPTLGDLRDYRSSGEYVATIVDGPSAAEYSAVFKGAGSVNAKIANATLTMSFDTTTESINWNCSGFASSAFEPSVCR